MKQLRYLFMAFAVALLATSCSQDELPGGGNADEPEQPRAYTFTVSPDLTMEGDAAARSEGTPEEMPTRCFMQMWGNNVLSDVKTSKPDENGSFTFSVTLPANTTYTFMFWADNSDGETPTDLREVQYTPGTVAFATKAQGTLETVDKTVELKHVVAKVTLKTTTDVTPEYSKTISLTASCASTYNVEEASASGFEDKSVSMEMSDAGLAANSEVLTTYIIPNPGNKTVTLGAHEMTRAISDVPLAANTHVTLQGDLSESSDKWGNPTSAYIEAKFRSYFYGDNGIPKGYNSQQPFFYEYQNGTIEDVTSFMREITRNDSFVIPSNDDVIITDNLSLENTPEYIYIYIYIDYNNTQFMINPDTDLRYPDFSIIYPGT